MEEKYKSLGIRDFFRRFPDKKSCLEYLVKQKWGKEYSCYKCSHKKYCRGSKPYHRQCTSCRYTESPTANTLFHKIKFNLVDAFIIVYLVSTNKKGISSTELSRKLQRRQKTCWLFRQKVLQAMESKKQVGLSGNIEINDFNLGVKKVIVKEKVLVVNQRVILAIEKKGRGVSHVYAQVIKDRSSRQIKGFMTNYIRKDSCIKSFQWQGYDPLTKDYEFVKRIKKSECKKAAFPLCDRLERSVGQWLKGMHHEVVYLQYYLNEFCYRFNRNQLKEEIFDHLLERMVTHVPRRYKDIIAYAPT